MRAYKDAVIWYKWLTLLCAQWPNDVDPRPTGRSKEGADAGAIAASAAEVSESKGTAKRRCTDSSVEEAKKAAKRRRQVHGILRKSLILLLRLQFWRGREPHY